MPQRENSKLASGVLKDDTIVALATPPGHAGIAVVRLSGAHACCIAEAMLKKKLRPREASLERVLSKTQALLDYCVVIFFQGPRSYTGEDIVEFQCHGSPIIVEQIISTCIQHGARLAEAGEFSQRAFLNDKMDLVQAEAVADLINANSNQAAKSALSSLKGEFSAQITLFCEKLLSLRILLEAHLDFPEEDISPVAHKTIHQELDSIHREIKVTLDNAKQGAILRDGMQVVIIGKPNAGKSSLLNCLAADEVAIVTAIPGTTRDVIRQQITIDGLPLHLVDTAGIRESQDEIEQIGIQRASEAIRTADAIILLMDIMDIMDIEDLKNLNYQPYWPHALELPDTDKLLFVLNKCDLCDDAVPGLVQDALQPTCIISAQDKTGICALKKLLKSQVGYHGGEGIIIARQRHIDALVRAMAHGIQAKSQFELGQFYEIVAEELRLMHDCLGEIVGKKTSDDLLGDIFSSFCIGK